MKLARHLRYLQWLSKATFIAFAASTALKSCLASILTTENQFPVFEPVCQTSFDASFNVHGKLTLSIIPPPTSVQADTTASIMVTLENVLSVRHWTCHHTTLYLLTDVVHEGIVKLGIATFSPLHSPKLNLHVLEESPNSLIMAHFHNNDFGSFIILDSTLGTKVYQPTQQILNQKIIFRKERLLFFQYSGNFLHFLVDDNSCISLDLRTWKFLAFQVPNSGATVFLPMPSHNSLATLQLVDFGIMKQNFVATNGAIDISPQKPFFSTNFLVKSIQYSPMNGRNLFFVLPSISALIFFYVNEENTTRFNLIHLAVLQSIDLTLIPPVTFWFDGQVSSEPYDIWMYAQTKIIYDLRIVNYHEILASKYYSQILPPMLNSFLETNFLKHPYLGAKLSSKIKREISFLSEELKNTQGPRSTLSEYFQQNLPRILQLFFGPPMTGAKFTFNIPEGYFTAVRQNMLLLFDPKPAKFYEVDPVGLKEIGGGHFWKEAEFVDKILEVAIVGPSIGYKGVKYVVAVHTLANHDNLFLSIFKFSPKYLALYGPDGTPLTSVDAKVWLLPVEDSLKLYLVVEYPLFAFLIEIERYTPMQKSVKKIELESPLEQCQLVENRIIFTFSGKMTIWPLNENLQPTVFNYQEKYRNDSSPAVLVFISPSLINGNLVFVFYGSFAVYVVYADLDGNFKFSIPVYIEYELQILDMPMLGYNPHTRSIRFIYPRPSLTGVSVLLLNLLTCRSSLIFVPVPFIANSIFEVGENSFFIRSEINSVETVHVGYFAIGHRSYAQELDDFVSSVHLIFHRSLPKLKEEVFDFLRIAEILKLQNSLEYNVFKLVVDLDAEESDINRRKFLQNRYKDLIRFAMKISTLDDFKNLLESFKDTRSSLFQNAKKFLKDQYKLAFFIDKMFVVNRLDTLSSLARDSKAFADFCYCHYYGVTTYEELLEGVKFYEMVNKRMEYLMNLYVIDCPEKSDEILMQVLKSLKVIEQKSLKGGLEIFLFENPDNKEKGILMHHSPLLLPLIHNPHQVLLGINIHVVHVIPSTWSIVQGLLYLEKLKLEYGVQYLQKSKIVVLQDSGKSVALLAKMKGYDQKLDIVSEVPRMEDWPLLSQETKLKSPLEEIAKKFKNDLENFVFETPRSLSRSPRQGDTKIGYLKPMFLSVDGISFQTPWEYYRDMSFEAPLKHLVIQVQFPLDSYSEVLPKDYRTTVDAIRYYKEQIEKRDSKSEKFFGIILSIANELLGRWNMAKNSVLMYCESFNENLSISDRQILENSQLLSEKSIMNLTLPAVQTEQASSAVTEKIPASFENVPHQIETNIHGSVIPEAAADPVGKLSVQNALNTAEPRQLKRKNSEEPAINQVETKPPPAANPLGPLSDPFQAIHFPASLYLGNPGLIGGPSTPQNLQIQYPRTIPYQLSYSRSQQVPRWNPNTAPLPPFLHNIPIGGGYIPFQLPNYSPVRPDFLPLSMSSGNPGGSVPNFSTRENTGGSIPPQSLGQYASGSKRSANDLMLRPGNSQKKWTVFQPGENFDATEQRNKIPAASTVDSTQPAQILPAEQQVEVEEESESGSPSEASSENEESEDDE